MSVKSVPIKRDVTPGLAYPALAGSDVRAPSVAAVILCILLVALTLRPGIVSMGPLLTSIINELGLTHTQASLLTRRSLCTSMRRTSARTAASSSCCGCSVTTRCGGGMRGEVRSPRAAG
jgi:hypothetical protein